MKAAIIIAVMSAGLLIVALTDTAKTYQRGIEHGQQLMRETMEAEAISQGVGEFGPDGSFRFKRVP